MDDYENNFRSLKRKRTKYHFVGPSNPEEQFVQHTGEPRYFYQICTFKHPDTNKYHMRQFVIGDDSHFLDIRDLYLSKSDCKKFYKRFKRHKYKRYDVYTLDAIPAPTLYDIETSHSELLNNDFDYTGFAPF